MGTKVKSGFFQMGNSNMREYLSRLSDYLLFYGVTETVELLIVGGAALSYKFDLRGTEDIDYCCQRNKQKDALDKSILRAAQDLGLTDDWMNTCILNILEHCEGVRTQVYTDLLIHKLFDGAELCDNYQNVLMVYAVSDIDLLCTKLKAGRQKDLRYIGVLCNYLITQYKLTFSTV